MDMFDNRDLKIHNLCKPSGLIKDATLMQLFITGQRLLKGWIESKMQSH